MKQLIGILFGVIMCSCTSLSSPSPTRFLPDDEAFRYIGRFLDEGADKIFAWSASRIEFRFSGDSICLHLSAVITDSAEKTDYYLLELDDESTILQISTDTHWLRNLGDGKHKLALVKRTEANVSMGIWKGVSGGPDLRLLPGESATVGSMEVIGNSITCGYGNEGDSQFCDFNPSTEDATRTYSSMAAAQLGMAYHAVCFSGKGIWQNYGRDTFELMPELWHRYMPQRKDPYLHSEPRSHVLINLGTNDFAHQIPPRRDFCTKYIQLIRDVRNAHPSSKIVLLTGSMMQGEPLEVLKSYLEEVKLTLEHEGLRNLYRFDLSPQGALGYGCDWHPNVVQHQKNAQELAEFLSSI